jgi:hypothetical protein
VIGDCTCKSCLGCRKTLKDCQEHNAHMTSANIELHRKLDKAEEFIDLAERALKFYADSQSYLIDDDLYDENWYADSVPDIEDTPVGFDDGKKAREALAKIRGT